MSQKWNSYKIILELLKKESHLREIARNVNLSPSTTQRNLNLLLEENIIDCIEEGKNLKYFLKKTLEAQNFIFIAENFKFNEFIKNNFDLRELISRIKKLTQDKLVIIFGSYANYSQNSKSDLDLYVETSNKKLKEKIENLNEIISVKIGRFDKNSILGKEILKNHVILQNIERFYYIIENEEN